MQWNVYIGAQGGDYSIKRVVKDDEEELVTYTTSSGEFFVTIEAINEHEAGYIALIQVLTRRVKDLERTASRNSTLELELRESITNYRHAAQSFGNVIRAGELSIANTGKRIVGSWCDRDVTRKFELQPDINFQSLVQKIMTAPSEDDCY